jgi:hypothetical protein
VIMSFNSCCLPGFFKFSSSTLEPALHNSVTFFKTRTLQLHSSSSSAPATRSTGHVGCWCPARGLHAPKSLLLFGTREGHALPFLAVHGVGWALRWSIYGWVESVTTRVLHMPPSPTESATIFTAGSLLFEFFFFFSSTLCCVFPLFILYNLLVYCSNFIEISVG